MKIALICNSRDSPEFFLFSGLYRRGQGKILNSNNEKEGRKMKGVRWLMALALGFGLIIGFAGCGDEDTITKADLCGNAIVKIIKNCDKPMWSIDGCLNDDDEIVKCVLNASGEDEEETCDNIQDCFPAD